MKPQRKIIPIRVELRFSDLTAVAGYLVRQSKRPARFFPEGDEVLTRIICHGVLSGQLRHPDAYEVLSRDYAAWQKTQRRSPRLPRRSAAKAGRRRRPAPDPREVAARRLGLTPKGEAAMFGHL